MLLFSLQADLLEDERECEKSTTVSAEVALDQPGAGRSPYQVTEPSEGEESHTSNVQHEQ